MANHLFESRLSDSFNEPDGYVLTHKASVSGFPFEVERHGDWLTIARWYLPDEYDFEDFLRVVEETFQNAEEHGFEFDEEPLLTVGSSALPKIARFDFDRPLESDDLRRNLNITPAQIGFARIDCELGDFYFDSNRLVGVFFYEKPHQTRSAFRFMSEMLPSSLRLRPEEIGEFVLGLARGKEMLRSEYEGQIDNELF